MKSWLAQGTLGRQVTFPLRTSFLKSLERRIKKTIGL